MIESNDARIVSGLLIGGFFIFLTGASFWKLDYQRPLEESLRAIARTRRRWLWIHCWMIGGIVVTLLGHAGLAYLFLGAGGPVHSVFGVLLFATGALPWLTGIMWRLTVLLWAAGEYHVSGEIPQGTDAWGAWFGNLHAAHLILSYLSWTVVGASVLDTGLLAPWVGWLGIGLGAMGAAGYALLKGGPFAPPIHAHLYTLIAGIPLIVRWG